MYHLREVAKNQFFNQCLGDSYTLIERFHCYERFQHYFKSHFGYDHVADLDPKADEFTKETIAFVVADKIIPIYSVKTYFVITDSGKTFERIGSKKG